MKKKSLWMLALILLIGSIPFTFASCDDEKEDQQTKADVTGHWYAEYDKTGSVNGQSFTKVVQYYEFEAGGNGYWTRFLLDGDTPIWQYGGLTGLENADGAFTYTSDADGTIHIKLRKGNDETSQWTLKFADGKIRGTDEAATYALSPATDEEIAFVNEWDGKWHGGSSSVNAGTPQRTYSLDWEIKEDGRQFTCLQDLADGKFKSEVKQIIFEYNSVGPDLVTPVRLTGSISMPIDVYNKEADARHLLIITQWTHASGRERLTQDSKSELEFYLNGMQRTIAISSDLYGWTLTVDKPQAYCCPEITAVETMDCWDAAMEILQEKGFEVGSLPLSNIGYSSAGMQAMGIQRFIDENRPDIKVAFTAAAASPFDINTVWQNYVETNQTSFVCALPLIMVAYNETYNLGLDYKDIFLPPLCDSIQTWILDKRYNSDGINERIGMDRKVNEILTPAACNWNEGIGKIMYDKFRENSLFDGTTWEPSHETQFFIMHSEGDTYMNWHVSEKMADFLKRKGCKVVTDFTNTGDHVFNAAFIFLITSCVMMENCSTQEDTQKTLDFLQMMMDEAQQNPESMGDLLNK